MKSSSSLFRFYFGCIIERNTTPGHALRWSALTPAGQVSANTLAGCKALVKSAVKPTR